MSQLGLVSAQTLKDIADAIRVKNPSVGELRPCDMAPAILAINGQNDEFNPDDLDLPSIPIGLFLGVPDENGILQAPNEVARVETGMYTTHIDNGVWNGMFKNNPLVHSAWFQNMQVIGSDSLKECFSGCTELTYVKFDNLELINNSNSLRSMCANCPALETIDFPDLHDITGNNALYAFAQGCSALIDVRFPSLQTLASGSMAYCFQNCTSLESVNFPALQTMSSNYSAQNLFDGCTGLKGVHFYALKTASGSQAMAKAFFNCASLQFVDFPSLESIGSQCFSNAFSGCTSLTSLSFPKLNNLSSTSSLRDFLTGSYIEEVHFPAAMEGEITTHDGFNTCFGRGENTVQFIFDL